MGQQYSQPQPGTTPRVIAAGLPRTGTASLCRALELLLDGPVYHGGTQVTLGPPDEIKTWIDILSHWPPSNTTQHHSNLELIRSRLDGYVAVADAPCCGLVPELLTLYPEAVVVCTVRDVDKWEKSMKGLGGVVTQWFLWVVLFPLPTLRHFVDYIDGLKAQWFCLYGEGAGLRKSYHKHMDWLKENVPEGKLVFLDVKDGWPPLCEALGVPVPKGLAFPHINDGEAIDKLAKKCLLRGLKRWAVILVVVAVGLLLMMRLFGAV